MQFINCSCMLEICSSNQLAQSLHQWSQMVTVQTNGVLDAQAHEVIILCSEIVLRKRRSEVVLGGSVTAKISEAICLFMCILYISIHLFINIYIHLDLHLHLYLPIYLSNCRSVDLLPAYL